jgi:hypothetical protein
MKPSILILTLVGFLALPAVCRAGGSATADGLAAAIQQTRRARVSMGFSAKGVSKALGRASALLAVSEAGTPSLEIAEASVALAALKAGVLAGADTPVAAHLHSLDDIVDLIQASGQLQPVVPTPASVKDLKKLKNRSRSVLKAWNKAFEKLGTQSSAASKQMRKSATKVVALISRHADVLSSAELARLDGVIDGFILLAHQIKFAAQPDWANAKTELFDIGVEYREAPFYLAATGQPLSWLQLASGEFEGIMHGSGPIMSLSEHDDYPAVFATTPGLLVRIDQNLLQTNRFSNAFKAKRLKKLMTKRYPREIPLLGLAYTLKGGAAGAKGGECQVAAGEWDADIRGLAQTIRKLGRPVFVRPAFEFNGSWNGYGKECFIEAFRRIVDIFRDEGALAVFIWNAKATSEFSDIQQIIADWYPGDAYVHYWGIDIFKSDLTNPQVTENMVQFIEQSALVGKPILVPECAPSFLDINDSATWSDWFLPFFDNVILAYPNLKGFCYANQDFTKLQGLTEWGDLRVDQSALKDSYALRIADPVFLHALP